MISSSVITFVVKRTWLCESGIKEGNVVLVVHPHNDEDAEYFERTWRANKGEEIHS